MSIVLCGIVIISLDASCNNGHLSVDLSAAEWSDSKKKRWLLGGRHHFDASFIFLFLMYNDRNEKNP
jgi:hypothetical protein